MRYVHIEIADYIILVPPEQIEDLPDGSRRFKMRALMDALAAIQRIPGDDLVVDRVSKMGVVRVPG